MGVTECDNMLMLLAVSNQMTEKERDIVIPLIIRGFKVSLFLIIYQKYTSYIRQGSYTSEK